MSRKKDDQSLSKAKNENSGRNSKVVRIDERPARSKVIAHRMRVFAVVMGIIIVLVAIGAMYYVKLSNLLYTSYEITNTVEREHVMTAKVLSYNNYFLTYSKDGIHCTDGHGADIWSAPYEMQDPMVEICGNYVAVADYNGRSIFIFDQSGEIGNIKLNNPIRNIKISANGILAIVVDGGDITPIYLYKYDGTEIAAFRTTMTKSGYPVSVGLSQNGKLVGVSYLFLDKGVLTTRVAFYNFDEVGQNETDNLVSGYEYQEELVPMIDFIDESTAYAVANDKLMFYQGKERPTNSANILIHEKIKSVYAGDGYVGLVYLDETGERRYCLDIYNATGKKENTIKFDLEYNDIFFDHDKVVIYNASSAEIFNVQGQKKFVGEFENPVMLMLPTNNATKYVLVTNNQIQTIVLR